MEPPKIETIEDGQRYTVDVEEDAGIPIFRYDEYVSGEDLREIAGDWGNVLERQNADRYLVDVRNITAHDDEDKRWLAETWVPNNIERGVHAAAAVHADSAITKMDNERIEEQLSAIDPDFEYQIFGDETEALVWLADQ